MIPEGISWTIALLEIRKVILDHFNYKKESKGLNGKLMLKSRIQCLMSKISDVLSAFKSGFRSSSF